MSPWDRCQEGGADSELREFVAAAIHDLHGLQAALSMGVDLLRSHPDDASTEPLLSLIERQATRLGRLTDDLFLLSVADTGRLAAYPDNVDLVALLPDAVAESGATDVDVQTAAELRAWADPAHVQRIVANLVRNAIRHGAPPIRVSALAGDDQVEIRVSDDGPGVPEEFVPRLFDRFARAGGAHQGAGLGLSIVAELAHLNGGSAHYEPRPPGHPGATFMVRLPREPGFAAAGDGWPGRSGNRHTGAHHERFGAAMARNRDLTKSLSGVLDDALALRARSEELRQSVRMLMRGRRRLMSEALALADSTPADPFLDLTAAPPGVPTDPPKEETDREVRVAPVGALCLNLAEVRRARAFTPDQAATALGVHRSTVSAIEHTDDHLLSTVRAFVDALGGHLEITAVFDDQRLALLRPPGPIEPDDLIATSRSDPPHPP